MCAFASLRASNTQHYNLPLYSISTCVQSAKERVFTLHVTLEIVWSSRGGKAEDHRNRIRSFHLALWARDLSSLAYSPPSPLF